MVEDDGEGVGEDLLCVVAIAHVVIASVTLEILLGDVFGAAVVAVDDFEEKYNESFFCLSENASKFFASNAEGSASLFALMRS